MASKKLTVAQQQALQVENELLKRQLEEQQSKADTMVNALGSVDLLGEIRKIREKGKSTAHEIQVTERHDHKNISLWTRMGKRIGPMHPENAIQTLHRFAALGIILSVEKPSREQVDAYMQTAEYKKWEIEEKKRRERKEGSRGQNNMKRLTEEIAKMTGQTVEALNRVLSASEVGKK